MADKISTLILKVDLECYRCYKEIRRILCKLQDKENIKTISYEEKSNSVIISGPFDPQKLSKKLRCKGGKVIKDVQIKESVKEKDILKEKPTERKPAESAPKEKEKPKETKPAEPEKETPKETKPEKEKPKPSEAPKEEKKPEKESKPAEQPKKEENAAEQDKKPEKENKPKPTEKEKKHEPNPEPAKTEPVQVTTAQPFFEPGQVCCPAPYYEGYYGGCRCCACGHVVMMGHTNGLGVCGPLHDGCRVYHFFSEEDPSTSSCSIM